MRAANDQNAFLKLMARDPKPEQDQLLNAVIRYRDAEAKLNSTSGDAETLAYVAWNEIDAEIVGGDMKATTLAGAVAALQLACHEMDGISSTELVEPLVRGALAFFEGQGAVAS